MCLNASITNYNMRKKTIHTHIQYHFTMTRSHAKLVSVGLRAL